MVCSSFICSRLRQLDVISVDSPVSHGHSFIGQSYPEYSLSLCHVTLSCDTLPGAQHKPFHCESPQAGLKMPSRPAVHLTPATRPLPDVPAFPNQTRLCVTGSGSQARRSRRSLTSRVRTHDLEPYSLLTHGLTLVAQSLFRPSRECTRIHARPGSPSSTHQSPARNGWPTLDV